MTPEIYRIHSTNQLVSNVYFSVLLPTLYILLKTLNDDIDDNYDGDYVAVQSDLAHFG